MEPSDSNYASHPHILVVDDEELVRTMIQQGIEHMGLRCSEVDSAEAALVFLSKETVDVMITDIIMSGMDGIELTRKVKAKYDIDVIMMTGYIEDYSYENIIETGASDFLQKPMTVKELIIRLKRVLRERAMQAERMEAQAKLKKSLITLYRVNTGIIQAMALTVEVRDPYTAGHQKRVAKIALAIAKEMGLPKDQMEGLRMAGLIHDLGKISVPAEILTKPGGLNYHEYGIIKTHPQVGYDILKSVEFPWPVAEMVLQHHERIDGSGYPKGLSGEEILLEARILSVADVVESMASHRPYRASIGIDKALNEISQHKGVLYDPAVVNTCLQLFREKAYTIK